MVVLVVDLVVFHCEVHYQSNVREYSATRGGYRSFGSSSYTTRVRITVDGGRSDRLCMVVIILLFLMGYAARVVPMFAVAEGSYFLWYLFS